MSIDKQSSKMAFVCDVCSARFEAEDTNQQSAGVHTLWIAAKKLRLVHAPAARRQMAHRMPAVCDRRLEIMDLVARFYLRLSN